ncbi:hypothetical protein [Ottowia massiliensis]|jgi:hypothetical protein|uniref:hypothetical protein n=1 Tax=Ottowia massiliensis TaxID=2045302 RepID=UPI000C81AE8D|nr:hypothetical protein [Ottowia massiliensis]
MSNETPRSEESGDSGALHSAINSAFDYVIENRSDYYRKNPSNLPQLDSVSGLISSYTRNNAAISGGASLIPGPWGMAAVIPELTLVIRNQIQMVYDIGVANGKQAQLTKELLIGIFLTAMGSSAGSLLTIHGGKILVRRASLQVIQKIIAMLGGRVTQQVIKSTVSKWLPFVGAAAMATWTGYMTKNIGEKANELFKLEIEDDPQTLDIELKPE